MFESIVEKLLNSYLAQYVEGIKGNLHLAVWSGNVTLDNLEIKKDIAERFSLPLKVVFGKIGRLHLSIPWSRLGSSPIEIVFESVHILLTSNVVDKTDDQLLAEIRQAKEFAVSHVENELKALSAAITEQMSNSSYLFQLVTKILNNLKVYIRDIHIHYSDDQFSLGFKLESLSILRSPFDNRYVYNKEGDPYLITHSCELVNSSIYSVCLADEEFSNGASSLVDLNYFTENEVKAQDFDLNKLIPPIQPYNQVLSPLSLSLHAHIDTMNKTVIVALDIGDINKSGINVTLTRSGFLSLIRIANSIKQEKIRKSNILLAQSQIASWDIESIKSIGKSDFMRLYSMSLAGNELTEDEKERLQSIFDVTPVRHLARWRLQCKKSVKPPITPQKSTEESSTSRIWGWIKDKTQLFNRSTTECEIAGVSLDVEQIQLLQEAMNADDLLQDISASGNFSLSFTLNRFTLSIIGIKDELSVSPRLNEIVFNLINLHASLAIQNVVDCNEVDTYNIQSRFCLSQFNTIFENEVMVKIDGSSPSTEIVPNAIMIDLTHTVTEAGNVLYLGCVVSPVELFIIPHKVCCIFGFVHSISQLSVNKELENYVSEGFTRLDTGTDDESSVSPISTFALPNLFAFDIDISAPIIHLYPDNNTESEELLIYLGKLIAKTNGASDIDNFSGIIDFKETKILSIVGIESMHFLKPIPVKIHFFYSLRQMSLNLDMIFEELFLQFTPTSLSSILNIYAQLNEVFNLPDKRINDPSDNKSKLLSVAERVAFNLSNPSIDGDYTDGTIRNNRQFASFNISCSLLLRHLGFSMYDELKQHILLVELNNVLIRLTHNPMGNNHIFIYFGLESAFVRNPHTDTVLFVSGQNGDIFLDTAKSRNSNSASIDDSATIRTARGDPDEEYEDYEDALEDFYKSLEIDVQLATSVKIDIKLSEIELYWQYKSVKIIYDTVLFYYELFLQIVSRNDSVTSFIIEEPVIKPSDVNLHDKFTNLIQNGIDSKTIPPLLMSNCKLELNVFVNETAISFLQNDDLIGRLSLHNIKSNTIRTEYGELLVKLSIVKGILIFHDRRLLESEEDSDILDLEMRFYSSEMQPSIPFSLCMIGNISSIKYMYYQNDLSCLIDYFSDGILNVFISKSYHKVIVAATNRHTLFNITIGESIIYVPRDEAILEGRVGSRLFLPFDSPTSTLLLILKSAVFRNCYTKCLADYTDNEILSPNDLQDQNLNFNDRFTLYIIMSSLSAALSIKNEYINILDPVDTEITYRGGALLNISTYATIFNLMLKSDTLTIFLNIINENLLSSSYIKKSNPVASNHPNGNIFRLNLCSYFQSLRINIDQITTIKLDQFILGFNYFSDDTVGIDTKINDNGYQLCLTAQSLSIDDARNCKIVYKRLLECKSKDPLPKNFPIINKSSIDYFLSSFSYKYSLATAKDFFALDTRFHGTKIIISSNSLTNNVHWMLDETIFTVNISLILNISDFFISSWTNCTFSSDQKDENKHSDSKLFQFSLNVASSKIIVHTDLNTMNKPKIELSLSASISFSHDTCYKINRFDIQRGIVYRVMPYQDTVIDTCLCDYLDIFIKGVYNNPADSNISITVLPFDLNLYSRDIGIILSAINSIKSDLPKPKDEIKTSSHNHVIPMNINIQGLTCTFLDDLRASIVPIIRVSFASDADLRSNKSDLNFSCNAYMCRIEYLNTNVGEWEPFLEKTRLQITFQSSDLNVNRKVTSTFNDESLVASKEIVKPPSKFKSYLYISTVGPLSFNITPHFCQLLLWLQPLLEKAPLLSTLPDQPETVHHTHYNYFSLNLTGYSYYAVNSLERESEQIGILTLYPKGERFPIDSLIGKKYKKDTDPKNLHLIPAPPFSLLNELLEKTFGDNFSPSYIEPVLRDLMVTRSVSRTIENFLNRPDYIDSDDVYDPCPPHIGPFPSGTAASVISLDRNGSVPINSPLIDGIPLSNWVNDATVQVASTQATSHSTGQVPTSHASSQAASAQASSQVSLKKLDFLQTYKNYYADGRSDLGLFTNLLCDDELLCHIITPHVSHKVLLLSSTVRIFNRSGIPIYLQFFDKKGSTWKIHSSLNVTAPISYLEPAQNTEVSYTNDIYLPGIEVTPHDSTNAIYLENGHFASAPHWVFWGPAHVNFRFKPGLSGLSTSNGWCKIIDTHVHQGARWRYSTINDNKLYFLVDIKSSRSAFPGEKEIRDITILPAMTILNALPTDLEVRFSGQDSISVGASSKGSSRKKKLTQYKNDPEYLVADTSFIELQLSSRSIMHLYSIIPNESLLAQFRLAFQSSLWSRPISSVFRTNATAVEMTFSSGHANIELELVRYPSKFSEKFISFAVTTSLWMVDRTGLGIKAIGDGRYYPSISGVVYLKAEKFNDIDLCTDGSTTVKCQIPAVGGFDILALPLGNMGTYSICLNTYKILYPTFHSYLDSRVVSIGPTYVVTNHTNSDLAIRCPSVSKASVDMPLIVLANSSAPLPWNSAKSSYEKDEDLQLTIEFKLLTKKYEKSEWSSPVLLGEQYAGVTYLGIDNGGKPLVFSLKVIPTSGVKHLVIGHPKPPSTLGPNEGFVLVNKSPDVKCVTLKTFHNDKNNSDVATSDSLSFSAKFNESVHIGWSHPFVYSSKMCQIYLWINRNTVAPKHPLILNLSSAAFRFRQMEVTLPAGGPIIITAQRMGNFITITVNSIASNSFHDNALSCQVTVTVPHIGFSLVSHHLREEILYAELSSTTAVISLRGEHQIFELRLADIQIDVHLRGTKNNVLLANRGSTGYKDRKYFFQLYADRPFSSLNDIYLRKVFLAIDDLQFDVSASTCEAIAAFYYECLQSLGTPARVRESLDDQKFLHKLAFSGKATLLDVEKWLDNGEVPALDLSFVKPLSISLDYLYIQGLSLYVWCSFEYSKLSMLGDLLRIGLKIISVSNNLELKGAPIQFPQEFATNVRATVSSLFESLKDKYIHYALSCIGSLLGYSSLVNIPRLPIMLGMNTIELAADAVDNVTAGLGNILSAFTFDSEYINKMQKERTSKASNIREGFESAGKSIGEGVLSLTNILTKPIEGAQKSGVGGFFKGIGIGIAGSIVKPIDHVRQAVSHVSRGIKADMAKPVGGYKWKCQVTRKPRMLWGEFGKVCEFSVEDAELKNQLGDILTKNLMKTLITSNTNIATVNKNKMLSTLLLFYPKQLVYASLSNDTQPNVVWKIDYLDILNTRASNYGVYVETKGWTFQVSATTPDMIYKVYKQVEHARSQAICFTRL